MTGALHSPAPPPMPNPQSGGALQAPGGPPLGQMPAGAAAPHEAPPAPTPAQATATLRHFDMIGGQLEKALSDPDLGKADMKSKVIDGMTSLVASRIISAGQAIAQLSSFPEKPFEQKTWLMNNLRQIQQAREIMLTHHAVAHAGTPYEPPPHPDGHMDHVGGMMEAHYKARAK